MKIYLVHLKMIINGKEEEFRLPNVYKSYESALKAAKEQIAHVKKLNSYNDSYHSKITHMRIQEYETNDNVWILID